MQNSAVYGLVLAGGKSSRMGKDKGAIVYHDTPQREHLFNLLQPVCQHTFYSIRKDQKEEFKDSSDYIVDNDEFRGPFNGILSAHAKFPGVAWMVMACDMPFMNEKALKKLLKLRNDTMDATAFSTAENGLPEPLAAIWEPGGLHKSREYLKNATSSCPRKYLINSNTKLVIPDEDLVLLNANSVADYNDVLSKLAH